MPTLTVHVPDEAALAPLARRLVAVLPRPAFVALTGDLGAGKTAFVKACAAVAGVDPATVVSPTFGLIHVHGGPDGRLVHADLYRLGDAAELHETGWDDAVAAADWTFVEWPERIPVALPADRLDVGIAITGPTTRTLTFAARGPAHAAAIDALAGDPRSAAPSGRGLG